MAKPAPSAPVPDFGIWRVIPPEEKIFLINRANSKGVLAILGTLGVFWTTAMALKIQFLVWVPLIIAPFLFQFATGRAWRQYRPRVMLEYLAARTAARRYAYATRAHNLELALIFRGTLERKFDQDDKMAELEATVENIKQAEVWVALFRDALIMMSEYPGGAKLEFSHLVNPSLELIGEPSKVPQEGCELVINDKKSDTRDRYKLTSDQPAALLAFHQKLTQMLKLSEIEPAVPDINSSIDY